METSTTTTTKDRDSLPTVFIDDILMSLKYFVDEHEAHLHIVDPDICVNCANKSCLYFCPVGAYREQGDGNIQVAYQSCIECGSCRVMCPNANVSWKFPRGGYGVAYKFG